MTTTHPILTKRRFLKTKPQSQEVVEVIKWILHKYKKYKSINKVT